MTKVQRQVFTLLCSGMSYPDIALRLQKSRSNIHTTCAHLRKLTGIKDTADPKECGQWRSRNKLSLLQQERGPTPKELEVLHMLGEGMSISTIAALRGVSKQCIMSQTCSARRRAKITGNLASDIKAYLAKRKADQEAMVKRIRARFFPEQSGHLNGDPCF